MIKGFPLVSIVLGCLAAPVLAQLSKPAPPAPAFVDSAPAKPVPAAPPTLKVGDAAPALTVDTWVKGEAVGGFQPGRVYVVEFFATWCLPCKASIPQMTAMQRAHPDLTFICVAGSERAKKGEPDQRLAKLTEFVKSQGATMGYRVAFDSTPTMSQSWLKAAGVRGIPSAFIVGGDGRIAEIGHPLDDSFKAALSKSLTKATAMRAAASETKAASASPKHGDVTGPTVPHEQGAAADITQAAPAPTW